MQTIATAAREYANRPKDERFPSLQALIDHAQHQRERSIEAMYNLRDLKFRAVDSADPLGTIAIESPKSSAVFSHWGFSQMARMVGAPAGYLRELPARIAAEALNYGITQAPTGTAATFLVQRPNGTPEPKVRSVTSDSYARIWDAELYSAIGKTIVDRDPSWALPPTWSGEPAGAYRGDRDSFLILTNGGSIVTDPSLTGSSNGSMFRGLLVRNSEVGAASVTIERILYRYVCGNHMLWGAVIDRRFRRRHVGTRVLRDTIREIHTIAYEWARASAERDQAIVKGLIDRELAQTRDGVIDELQAIGFTRAQAETAYQTCERTEQVSPRTYWGIAQGATRASQESGYQDDRYVFDQLAAKLLSRGAQLVRV